MTASYDYDQEQVHIDVPMWIEDWKELEHALSAEPSEGRDEALHQLVAIAQGGCASGAYMPAVTYYKAVATMGEHGNEILTAIEECQENPWELVKAGESWAGAACALVSAAVELWVGQALSELGVEP